MSNDAFDEIVDTLLGLGGQRVWSLMVTLFGDLAQNEGSTISGPVLSAVMARMDIRPEAVRVALHRLRNDGWIISHRTGRTGRHALTPSSRAKTLRASSRIYEDAFSTDPIWYVALTHHTDPKHHEAMIEAGYAPLLPRVYIGARDAHTTLDILRLTADAAPDWLRHEVASRLGQQDYVALFDALQEARTCLSDVQLSPIQTTVLRCLIVHNWRRIILRHPAVPLALLPEGWVGQNCQALVKVLLAQFDRPDLTSLELET